MAKNFAELLHAAMKIDANGAVGKAREGCDFRAGHAFDETKDEWLAIGFGERADHVENRVGFDARVGGMLFGKRAALNLDDGGFFVEFVVGFRPAMKICCTIASDRCEPARKSRDVTQCVEPRQSLEKNVVNEIINVREGHSAKQNAVDHAGIAGVKKSEGGAVTTLSCKD
jgi:hypothetical protein